MPAAFSTSGPRPLDLLAPLAERVGMRPLLVLAVLLSSVAARAESPLVKARPYYARTPPGYDPARPAPLLLFLHPYNTQDARQALERFQVTPITDEKRLLLAAPDGLLQKGKPGAPHFWNATDACCDFAQSGVDDVAYLSAVVADMRARYRVDDARIFVLGYSNGGFMVHRLLCDLPSTFAAGASIAGSGWKDPKRCHPDAPASLLEVHGDADDMVPYQGNDGQPAAEDAISAWARAIGCKSPARPGPPLDLIPDLPGTETTVTSFPCPAGAAELWTVHGGKHRALGPSVRAAIDFLLQHPKPPRPTAAPR
jgi:polyhydroxybutyrate depolymerase